MRRGGGLRHGRLVAARRGSGPEQPSRADRVARGRTPGPWLRVLAGVEGYRTAMRAFAETHADQNESDHAALQTAVKDGRAQAATEI
jgi:hypothetical protein